MVGNPLQQYFRQPKIYISLPSQGIYNREGTLQGDPSNLPVYGMTGMDEIIIKTPDALLSGESTVKVVESCVPGIKDAWAMPVTDTDLVFAAIRIATYGNTITIENKCPHCSAENEFNLDLNMIIEHYSHCSYENKLVLDQMVIKTQPLTYKQSTGYLLENFKIQQKLVQLAQVEDVEAQQTEYKIIFDTVAELQKTLYIDSIEAIEVGNQVVTERTYINEWLSNCDKSIFDRIKQHIETNQENWKLPAYPVECTSCAEQIQLKIELDQSNFFVQA
jgi:hypothetical protein